jgi:hypothetical protein
MPVHSNEAVAERLMKLTGSCQGEMKNAGREGKDEWE